MGLNDTGKVGWIILFFILTFTALPFVLVDFGNDESISVTSIDENLNSIQDSQDELKNNLSFTGAFAFLLNFFKNMLGIAFFTVIGLPWYIYPFFVFLGIMLYLLLLKYVPTVGGGG